MKISLIIAGVAVLAVLFSSIFQFSRNRTAGAYIQLAGAAFLVAVIVFHVAEEYRLFPAMGWGLPHSPGHYLDLGSAIAGLVLFSIGYALRKVAGPRS